jgi:uncharacterized protein (TIGR02421 family)
MPEPRREPAGTPVKRPDPDQLSPYHRTVRLLADRLVEAQRPIRILDACKWSDDVERDFFASGCKELPNVTREYYEARPLGFDLDATRQQFFAIERDVRRDLGLLNPAGELMLKACREYRAVLEMLRARGTREFSPIAQGLYGSTFDRFHAGDPTTGDLGRTMAAILQRLTGDQAIEADERTFDAHAAVTHLAARMDDHFGPGVVKVRVSDGVMADASAGADYIKLRADARFSLRDLGVLEVHEGWVHIGTTLNGMLQPVCTFLSKGTPSCTVTQEGIAIIQEIFTFRSMPARIQALVDRVEAIRMAEEGADFLHVFNALLARSGEPREAYQTAQRAFRGSLPQGAGPFTKDLSYSRGFVLIYNFVRVAVRMGLASRIPLLFLGKIRLGDLGILHQLVEDGTLVPPHHLPPPYDDLRGLSAWMCYSNFLNTIDLSRAVDDYAALLAGKASGL